MRRAGVLRTVLLLLASLMCGDSARGAAPLESSRALLTAMRRSGRAEAALRYTLTSIPGEPATVIRGRLALEPPDRARLDVITTGESIAVRADGGEWLDPAGGQLVRLSPERVAPALRWWRVLLGDAGTVRERRDSPGRFWLVLPAQGATPADSALVQFDSRGLPARLELTGDAGATVFRLTEWRFVKARGRAAFTIAPPPGVVEVTLP